MTHLLEEQTMRKVTWRLTPFLAVLYIVSFIDRVNMGFAALSMNKQLGLTPVMFGVAGGIFFLSYFLFEVPSNLILHRVGARLWIARVMITWGAISSATAFVTGAQQLYTLRFLLGAAEAGFFPGIILYLTYWFPERWRARVTAGFMTAIPVASFIGSPISAALLNLHGFLGLAGWRWMFLIEGLPAIVLGFVVLIFLTDHVSHAHWLMADEKNWLIQALREEEDRTVRRDKAGSVRQFLNARVVGLGVVYFGLSAGLYGVELWLPLILKGYGLGNLSIGFMAGVPYVIAIAGMLVWARHSDRFGERVWHVIGAASAGCVGFIAAALVHQFSIALLCITVAVTGIMASRPPFWSLPTQVLTGQAAAGGIALINAIGNLGGFAGPYVMGWATQASGSFKTGLLMIGASLFLSCCLTYGMSRSSLPKNDIEFLSKKHA
jgi:ACS family tartrate transporter-like MFS transporter